MYEDGDGIPADLPLRHVFARAADPDWGTGMAGRISAAGVLPLLTVEPWTEPDDALLARWADGLAKVGRVLLRYQHEMNGDWYPWGSDPAAFRDRWQRFFSRMPTNVESVWCPNAGAGLERWLPPTPPAWAGWDAYAWHGESLAGLSTETLGQLKTLCPAAKLVICETARERGSGQAAWLRQSLQWASAQGVAAYCWFNVDKEQAWRLAPRGRLLLRGSSR